MSKQLSVIELKALAYDQIMQIEQYQGQSEQCKNNLRTINAEILAMMRVEQMAAKAAEEKAAAEKKEEKKPQADASGETGVSPDGQPPASP